MFYLDSEQPAKNCKFLLVSKLVFSWSPGFSGERN